MKLQVLQDNLGNQTGVYVPIEDWNLIKNNYPDIETLDQELPQWEKDLIDSRLETITKNPERLKPIESLFEELKRKI
jgi:hypothetical protein